MCICIFILILIYASWLLGFTSVQLGSDWVRCEAGRVESSRLPIVIYLYHYCIKLDMCVCVRVWLVCVLQFLL